MGALCCTANIANVPCLLFHLDSGPKLTPDNGSTSNHCNHCNQRLFGIPCFCFLYQLGRSRLESPLVFFGTFLITGKLYVEHTTVTEGRSCMPVLMHRKLTKCHPSSFSRAISISFWHSKAKGNMQQPPGTQKVSKRD